MKDIFEFIGDCCFALSLFVQYMLHEAWGFILLVARVAWVVVLLSLTAHAGGYCYHNNYVQHEYIHDYTPQNIIEHQNIFYSVGQDVRQYAVAPQAVMQAQAGEVERQIARLQDRLVEYRQQSQYVQPQVAQPQMVYCVPMQAQAAYCPPGTVPAAVPQAQQPNPQYQPQPAPQPAPAQPQPGTPPQTFSQRAPVANVIQATCIKCHGGQSVKGDLDFTKELTCEQKQKAITKAAVGEMPKGGPKLSPEQFVQLSKEISALKTAGASIGESTDD